MSRSASLSAIRRAASLSRKTFAGGAPRSKKKRCPCGEMTAKRAKARGHKCSYTTIDSIALSAGIAAH